MNWSAAAIVVAACAAAAGAFAAGAGCIPDLPSNPAPELASAPETVNYCGDGIIELSAGEQCDPGPGAVDAGIGACSPTCQMQCPSGGTPWPSNNHCYSVASASGATSLEKASAECAGGSHVVTFASEAEYDHVLPLLDGGRPFWVGLEMGLLPPGSYGSVDSFEPGWSSRCTGCYAHTTSADAIPVFPDASSEAGGEDCIAAFADPSEPWNEFPCRGLRYVNLDVVCELEPVGRQSAECEAGLCIDLVKTQTVKTYVYQATPASADDASNACVALGGTLVVLQSSDEREQLWRELSHLNAVPQAVWIGLSQVSASGRHVVTTWQWDDLTPADGPDAGYPSAWAAGEPLGSEQGGTTRAFLYQSTASPVDDTLASNQSTLAPGGLLPYVCEIRR